MIKNKYNNKKTLIDGILFDSKAEGERYQELKLLQRAGEIKLLTLQPSFVLLDGFRHKGKAHIAIKYIADFYYEDVRAKQIIVEDTKGIETKEFRIKKKLFLSKFGKDYTLRISKKKGRSFTFTDF